MSMPPIDTPVGSFEVRCRVGQFVMDSDDPDRAPDLIAVGGTVTIEPDVRRPIRVHGENGPRVVGVDALEFTIDPATGKLIHPDGEPGVELIDPTDPHLDPQGWTYTATVRPEKGRSWSVTFTAPADGDVVDLGGIVSVAPSPGVTENYMQQTVTARDEAETFAVRAETAATEAEDWAPNFTWDGTRLVIDGEQGPDLEGPPGKAVEGIEDVPGLQAVLDRLTYDSGWRDITDRLSDGLRKSTSNGRALLRRQGDRLIIDLHLTVEREGATTLLVLPSQWRPDVPVMGPYTLWTATSPDHSRPPSPTMGFLGPNGTSVRSYLPLPSPGTVMAWIELPISTTPPTTPIGDPG